MKPKEPVDVWAPTISQLIMASEQAILAALDTNLLLAARTLQAEHAALGEESSDEPNPPHLAIAESILILAATLRELISSYRAVTNQLLGDR